MPNLTADSYAKLQDLLKDPSLSEGTRARAQTAIETYEAQQAPAEQQPMGPPPPPPVGLDPNLPLVPQALATLPATNHPGGDQAASSEWMSAGPGSAENAVFAYEPPLAVAQKKLLENPEILRSFGFEHILPTPEEISKITTDSPEYQAFADYEWNRVSSEASKAGRKAYRYSKAPWLQGGGAMSAIDTLGMKARGLATPVMNGIDSFILGMDDTVTLGAGAAAERLAGSGLPEGADLNSPEANPAERQAYVQDEHPVMNILGRITGLAAPWGAGGMVYRGLSNAGKALAGPGAKLGARLGTSALAGAGAEAALETGRIGAETAASTLGGTDEPAPEEAQQRVATAGALGGAFGFGGELAGSALKGGAGFVVDQVGARYGQQVAGVLDKVAEAGGKYSLLKGIKLSPQTEALIQRARGEGVAPTDILAQQIAPQMKEAANQEVKEKIAAVTQVKEEFFATPEGRQILPSKNLLERGFDILRRKHDAPAGKALRGVDVSTAPARVKRILNSEISDVGLKPGPDGIPLKPEEAEAFLSGSWSRRLGRKAGKGGATGELTTAEKKALAALGNTRAAATSENPAQRTALEKSAVENPGTLYKGMTLTDDALRSIERDGVMKFPNYSSAGADRSYAEGYTVGGNGSPVLLEVNGLPMAHAKSSREMLLPPGDYKVTGSRKEALKIAELGQSVPATILTVESTAKKAAQGSGSIATELRRRGIDQVYVFPRRHNARSQEELLKSMKGFREQNQSVRELQELDEAARMDRDARTLGGVKGGWSALQNENSKLIGAAKALEKKVAPGGDAFPALSAHALQKRGDLPKVQALRQTAARAGGDVPQTLDRIRMLDPLTQLRNVANYGPTRANASRGIFSANTEAAAIRAYPALKAGGSAPGLRGGLGGRLSTLSGNPMAIELEEEP